MTHLRVAGVQMNPTVGDLEGNAGLIREAMVWAEGAAADVLLLPELALTGYPPEDLLLRDAFVARNLEVLHEIAASAGSTVTVVGFVDRVEANSPDDDSVSRRVANAAAVLAGGEIRGIYHKCLLPNYGVFDEQRHFAHGSSPATVFGIAGVAVGVSICEDIWSPDGPPSQQAAAGAQILVNINGSPYDQNRGAERAALLSAEARRSGVPVVYVNMVGGQDELVFDGDSMVFDPDGSLRYRGPQFAEARFVLDVPVGASSVRPVVSMAGHGIAAEAPVEPPPSVEPLGDEAEVYAALVTGLRDYVGKNGFREVVIGLSGGIDSALTAAIAVDALGPDAVLGVTMPSRYSSQGSVDDSRDLAARLGCRFESVAIDDIFGSFLDSLGPMFAGTEPNVAEENLQARIRGAILMGISNKFGGMVVTTGNKSEMAVGYATLYGDMAGGFAVLKDVAKTLVYRLSEWRNRDHEVIPRSIIDKPPSAELRPDQKDSDSLPDYDLLDAILERYVEHDEAADSIIGEGFDAATVLRVARLVDRNEYKRRQAAPGVRITKKAFGRDRRLPITNRFSSR